VIEGVRVPDAVWNHLLRHAAEAAPEECCGLLLGRTGEIVEAVATPNVAPEPVRRFEVDPAAHFAAIRRARLSGMEVVGAYHSHPRGAPLPSETDFAEALPDELFLHVLIAPASGEIAGYRWSAGRFVPVTLVRDK
jgi:proteasome lid subunit RPN8/RPN11